MKYVAT